MIDKDTFFYLSYPHCRKKNIGAKKKLSSAKALQKASQICEKIGIKCLNKSACELYLVHFGIMRFSTVLPTT